MTTLRQRKTRLIFETESEVKERGKYRAVIIEAMPHFAMVRLKGTRTKFPIPYAAIYHAAARLAAIEARDAKKRGRK